MLPLRRLLLVLIVLLAAPPTASAATDIVVENLKGVDLAARQAHLNFVIRELAMILGAPPTHAVAALGLYEFELSTDHRLAFIHTDPDGPAGTSAWNDLSEAEEPSTVQYLPSVIFRKGLPWSLEAGGQIGWLATSRQFKVGGYGRWAFVGGWDKVPDVAVRLAYDGYVGNEQLDLGVFQFDLAIGYTFKASTSAARAAARFSPFAGYAFLMAHANPIAEVDGISAVTAWADNAVDGTDPRDFRFHRFFAGMELRSGQVVFRFSADVTGPRGGPLMVAMNFSLGARL
jgi:hypothetical protein